MNHCKKILHVFLCIQHILPVVVVIVFLLGFWCNLNLLPFRWIVILISFILFSLCILFAHNYKGKQLFLSIIILVLSVVCVMTATTLQIKQRVQYGIEENSIAQSVGTIISTPTKGKQDQWFFDIQLHSVNSIWSDVVEARGVMRIFYNQDCSHYCVGDRCIIEGSYVVTEQQSSLCFASSIEVQLQERGHLSRILNRIRAIPSQIDVTYFSNVSAYTRSLCMLLLCGIDPLADSQLKDMARESGCAHVIALSGMHLHIIGMCCTLFLRKVTGKKRARIITAPILVLYVIMVGPRPSLIRALLMYLVHLCFQKITLTQVLCITFCIQLLLFPQTMVQLGALYSYTALLALFLLGSPLCALFSQWLPNILSIPLASSLSVVLVTSIFSLYSFDMWYPVGLLIAPIASVCAIGILISTLLLLGFPCTVLYVCIEYQAHIIRALFLVGSTWTTLYASHVRSFELLCFFGIVLTVVILCAYAVFTQQRRRRRHYDLGFSLRLDQRNHTDTQ